MKNIFFLPVMILFSILICSCRQPEKTETLSQKIQLRDGWFVQSSAKLTADGAVLSSPGIETQSWYQASVPSTIMGVLTSDGEYPDLFMGKNFENADPDRFNVAWWYRKEFQVPEITDQQHVFLAFDGISYYANVWLNGKQIASRDTMKGAFRRFKLDITTFLKEGENVLAVEVFKQQPGDFGIGFADWNPVPPDKNMGIWRDVYMDVSGEVGMEEVKVETKLNLETLDEASLEIKVALQNYSSTAIEGKLKGKFEGTEFEYPVALKAGEQKMVKISEKEISSLHLQHPKLWWCNNLGDPNLYHLNMQFISEGNVQDEQNVAFGIRDIQSYYDSAGHKGFKLNGKKVLIKGAGWTDDIFLRDTPERNEIQVRYVKDMNLNTIRFESFWGSSQNIYDLCDKYGIMVMVGWSCQWEWEGYLGKSCDEFGGIQTNDEIDLMAQSFEDQITWLGNHPSIITWFVGSDKLPKPELEKRYKATLDSLDDRPYLGAAAGKNSDISGPTGVKMNGPYEYEGPNYWYTDSINGGAFGFNTETGPGPQIPVKESLIKMIPADKLWPVNDTWSYHCTSAEEAFNTLDVFNEAMNNRYGKPEDLDAYLLKSHVMQYEAMKGMFEAFRVNLDNTTGIVQWMLNSAWPSLFWQLYDYYLLPTSAYYAVKKANEPLQLFYNYGDNGIYAVNEQNNGQNDLKAVISFYDFNSRKIQSKEINFDIGPRSSQKIYTAEKITQNTFLHLALAEKAGKEIAENFYWLSNKQDTYDWEATTWAYTPMNGFADFKALNHLPGSSVDCVVKRVRESKNDSLMYAITLSNKSDKIAFFLNAAIRNPKGETVFPAFYSDNYLSLIPGETKTIAVNLPAEISGESLKLVLSGWNINQQEITLK